MSAWAAELVRIATRPTIARARYGFAASRRGGCQERGARGAFLPRGDYVNCVTWAAQALQLGAEALGLPGVLSRADWSLCMLEAGQDRRGVTLAAHRLGWADEPIDAKANPVDWRPGAAYVAQGIRLGKDDVWGTGDGEGGHACLVLSLGDGDPHLLILEANGKPTGGAVLGGLDGVGSRCALPRNARDWPAGSWPSDVVPIGADAMTAHYDEWWVARLREPLG